MKANRAIGGKLNMIYINENNEILTVSQDPEPLNPLEEECYSIKFVSCDNYKMTENDNWEGLDELLYPNLSTSKEEQEKYEEELDGYPKLIEKYEYENLDVNKLFDRINDGDKFWVAPILVFQHGTSRFSTHINGALTGFAYLSKKDEHFSLKNKEEFYNIVEKNLEDYTEYCNGSVCYALLERPDGTSDSIGNLYSDDDHLYFDLMKHLPRKQGIQYYELQKDVFDELGCTSNKWVISSERFISTHDKYLSFQETVEEFEKIYK